MSANLNLNKPVSVPRARTNRNNLILAVAIPISIIAIVLLLYYINPKFRTEIQKLLRFRKGAVSVAPQVSFTLNPEEVKPNTAFSIAGQFEDGNGQPVAVKNGYYYVFSLDAQSNKQGLVTQGSLGTNTATFNVLVPTTNWQDQTKFDVLVTDTALTANDLTSMVKPSGAAALGTQGGYNPITGTNVLVRSVEQV